ESLGGGRAGEAGPAARSLGEPARVQEQVRSLVDERRAEEAEIDAGAAAAALAVEQGGDGGEGAERAGAVVVVRDRVKDRLVVAALGGHQARPGLEDRIEPRQRAERTPRAEARDGGVHQVRLRRPQPL